MKKIVKSLLLCMIIMILLTGCGKKSKEFVLKNSTKWDLKQFSEELYNNKVNTIDKYENKYYSVVGVVAEIEKNRIALYDSLSGSLFVINLSKEDIKKITKEQEVEVAGKLTNISDCNRDSSNLYDLDVNNGLLEDAYLVNDEF